MLSFGQTLKWRHYFQITSHISFTLIFLYRNFLSFIGQYILPVPIYMCVQLILADISIRLIYWSSAAPNHSHIVAIRQTGDAQDTEQKKSPSPFKYKRKDTTLWHSQSGFRVVSGLFSNDTLNINNAAAAVSGLRGRPHSLIHAGQYLPFSRAQQTLGLTTERAIIQRCLGVQ